MKRELLIVCRYCLAPYIPVATASFTEPAKMRALPARRAHSACDSLPQPARRKL